MERALGALELLGTAEQTEGEMSDGGGSGGGGGSAELTRALAAALRAAPDNAELARAVLGQMLEESPSGGSELAEELELGQSAADLDLAELVARLHLAAEQPARALAQLESLFSECDGWAPRHLRLQIRALRALDRVEEARTLYDDAVLRNATFEDPDLRALLDAKVRLFSGPRRGAATQEVTPLEVKVYSNDDTSVSEIERVLQPPSERVSFEDVGGLDSVKRQIHKKIVLPFQKPSLIARFKKKIGGGILMYGPPGCGKTLLARATAGECDASFLNVALSDVLDMYIGESEQRLHALFEKARASAPAVLFFDELEGLGGRREFTREATSSKLVSQFLSELDGFAQNNTGVLVLAATNVPWAIDSAFRRPGRFDRVLFVPPPDRAARERILQLHLSGRPHDPTLDLGAVADKARGFSGADLEHLIESAADVAIDEALATDEQTRIEQRHLRDALEDVRPTTLEWLTTARNYARYANEAGQYDDVLAFLRQHGK